MNTEDSERKGNPGSPFYSSQPVYQSTPMIVPTQQPQQPPPPPQQLPPTKREKKTIRIRDPNQGGKDITEEIMSGSGSSRNPTPPIGRPSSTPTPPQISSHVPEHSPLIYSPVELIHDSASLHLPLSSDPKPEENPKLDAVLKSPVFRSLCSNERKDQAGQTTEFSVLDTQKELPSTPPAPHLPAAEPPSIVAATIPMSPVVCCTPVFGGNSVDGCELNSQIEETTPDPSAAPCTESPELLEPEDPQDNVCKEASVEMAHSDIAVTLCTNIIPEENGISDHVADMDTTLRITPEDEKPVAVHYEEPEVVTLIEEKMERAPCLIGQPALSTSVLSPVEDGTATFANSTTVSPPFTPTITPQRDLEREEDVRTPPCDNADDAPKTDQVEVHAKVLPHTTPELPFLHTRRSPVQGKPLMPGLQSLLWETNPP